MKKQLFYLTAAIILTATFAACTAEIITIPTGVTLDQSSITLSPGNSLTLVADVYPDEAAIKTLTWSSSDPQVATVAGGLVTAITEGTATITVTTNSGQRTTACAVTVAYPVSGVLLDKISSLLLAGQSLRLTATVLPDDTPDKAVIWESSAPDVATVVNGVVSAIAPGTAIITATTEVGHRKANSTVKVLSENTGIISMTFQPTDFLSFNMSGSGEIDIDWNDIAFDSYTFSGGYLYSYFHNYSGGWLPRTVTIYGNNIASLHCNSRQVTSLDVSKCVTLTTLYCFDNQITNLDVSNNTALTILDCSGNRLTELDVRSNPVLSTLDCSRNRLTSLYVGMNSALTKIKCSYNELSVSALDDLFEMLPIVEGGSLDYGDNPGSATSNISIAEHKGWLVPKQMFLTVQGAGLVRFQMAGSGMVVIDWGDGSPETSGTLSSQTSSFSNTFTGLYTHTIKITGVNITLLNCSSNRLTSLDVSNHTALTNLNCSLNQLTDLDVSAHTALTNLNCSINQITDLDVSKNTALTDLDCSYNRLTSLNLNKMLISVECNWNQLESFDLSNSTALIHLNCSSNQLTNLDVSNNVELIDLDCSTNQLSSLDMSENTAIEVLNCSDNLLTNLDMSHNTMLVYINCGANQLSAEALEDLFETLHGNYIYGVNKRISIWNNPGAGSCDRNIAFGKGWNFN